MLTPQEISEKVFVRAVFGGYDMTGVDDFLESVAADYTALYKDNAILKSKIKVLVEKVEEYRSTEDAMRMALLTAQRMGEDMLADVNIQKQQLLSQTDEVIAAKLLEMEQKLAAEELRLTAAEKETAKFIEVSQAIMRKHSEFLTKIERARRAIKAPPAQPEPSQEEKIVAAAAQIDTAVEKLTSPPAPAPAPVSEPDFEDEGEPTKQYIPKSGENVPIPDYTEEDTETPKPKFDFENLKFGANFTDED